jgi:hypothetical protein
MYVYGRAAGAWENGSGRLSRKKALRVPLSLQYTLSLGIVVFLCDFPAGRTRILISRLPAAAGNTLLLSWVRARAGSLRIDVRESSPKEAAAD